MRVRQSVEEPSDEELLLVTNEGAEMAFAELVGRHVDAARNQARRRRRYERMLARLPETESAPDVAEEAIRRVDGERKAAIVAACVRTLRRAEQEVVALCDMSGLSYARSGDRARRPDRHSAIAAAQSPRATASHARRARARTVDPQRRMQRGKLRITLASAGTAVDLGGGGAIAYSAIATNSVTDESSARCYTVATYSDTGDNFPGTSISAADTTDAPGRVTSAIDVCASLWRAGFLQAGLPGPVGNPDQATYPFLPWWAASWRTVRLPSSPEPLPPVASSASSPSRLGRQDRRSHSNQL